MIYFFNGLEKNEKDELESLSLYVGVVIKKGKKAKTFSILFGRKEVCILEYCSLIGSLHNLSNNKSGNSHSRLKDA